jgi:hypothetical protein
MVACILARIFRARLFFRVADTLFPIFAWAAAPELRLLGRGAV